MPSTLALIVALSAQLADTETYEFRGLLTEASVELAITEITEHNYSRLRITSPGGQDLPAIRFGRFIRSSKVDLVISGYCLSACASFILPAAHRARILPNALVAFHTTAATASVAIDRSFETLETPERLNGFFDAISSYYAEIGIDPALYVDAIAAHNVTCVGTDDRFLSGAFVSMEYEYWVPSPHYLAANGYSFTGYWPAMNDVAGMFERIMGYQPSHYLGGTVQELQDLRSSIPDLETCEGEYEVSPLGIARPIEN